MEIKLNLTLDDRLVAWGKKVLKKRILIPLGGVLLLLGASLVFANVPHVFTNRQLIEVTQINDNFQAVVDISVPVGGIIPWHKTLVDRISLTEQWVECNRQTINDRESPSF